MLPVGFTHNIFLLLKETVNPKNQKYVFVTVTSFSAGYLSKYFSYDTSCLLSFNIMELNGSLLVVLSRVPPGLQNMETHTKTI